MSSDYYISTIGLAEKDVAALNRILVLSLKRERVYSIEKRAHDRADIIIVNADIEMAIAKVKQVARKAQSIVYATSFPDLKNFPDMIKLPFLGSRAIRMFDQIIVRKTGDLPEISFSDDNTLYEIDRVSTSYIESSFVDNDLMQVLVLDDSASVRKQMEIVLKANNLVPVMADTGERALEIMETNRIDFAFLDVVLPGIDGYKVCKKIKKLNNIPIVMLTSKSSPFDRVRGSLAGCDMYLTKPVSQQDFRVALKKCLKIPEPGGDRVPLHEAG